LLRFGFEVARNAAKQGFVGSKKLAGPCVAHALKAAASKISFCQFHGAGIGVGVAGNLAQHLVAACGVGGDKCRAQFLSGKVRKWKW